MKLKGKLLLVLTLVLLMIPMIASAEEVGPKLWINGNFVTTDAAPFIDNGRTLVPVRVISETLGFKVDWNEIERKVTIYVNNSENNQALALTIDNTKAYLGEKELTLDVAPKIKDGRTFVPLRFIAEAFGLKVDWDNANRTAIIGEGYVAPTQEVTTTFHDGLTESPYPNRQIKGNINNKGEKIYHCPGQRDYVKTSIDESKGERWFETEDEAINAGWRKAKV